MKMPSFTTTKVLLLAALAGALLALAGCASGEPAPASTPDVAAQPTVAQPATQPTADQPPAAVASPTQAEPVDGVVPPRPAAQDAVYGGNLRMAYFRAPTSPDGYQSDGGYEGFFMHTNNEPIVAIGKDGRFDPASSLAHSFEILDEGYRVRFHLREGVQFQGGFGEMTSEDVAFSLNRWNAPDASGCADCLSLFVNVEGAEIVDNYTVDLVLHTLDTNIVSKMFGRETFIHSKQNWEQVGGQDAHKDKSIGTGPYKLTNWQVGINLEYEAHPDWWQHKPYADNVNIATITETRTRLAALQTGEVNIAFLQAEMIPAALEDPGIHVWDGPFGWEGWVWNHGLPPLDDLRLRRALVKALDRDAINNAIYLNTMAVKKGHQLDPEGPYGINADDLWDGEFLSYDPEAARQLVEEVARDKGLSLPLQIRGACEVRPDRQQLCELLQSVWSEIGVEFTIETTPNVSASSEVMEQCTAHHQATGGGTLFPYQMEANMSSLNAGNYAVRCLGNGSVLSPEAQAAQDKLDELLQQASSTLDEVERLDIYREVQRIGLENLFRGIPVFHRKNFFGCYTATTGGCEGESPNRAEGFFRQGDFWVK